MRPWIHKTKKESTLVILSGSVRGGEKTWETLYRNLIDVYNADIALAVGESTDKTSSLYTKAKYIWELKEYGDDWSTYYIENGLHLSINAITKERAPHFGLAAPLPGIKGSAREIQWKSIVVEGTSGLLIMAFKHFVLNNYLRILQKYDRIIWARADQYYFKPHPKLPLNYLWIPEGQDWGGVCDRHAIFPSKESTRFLSILETVKDNPDLARRFTSPESWHMLHLEQNGLLSSLRRYDRVQATVCVDSDKSRWRGPAPWVTHPEHSDLKLKYPEEYFDNI